MRPHHNVAGTQEGIGHLVYDNVLDTLSNDLAHFPNRLAEPETLGCRPEPPPGGVAWGLRRLVKKKESSLYAPRGCLATPGNAPL